MSPGEAATILVALIVTGAVAYFFVLPSLQTNTLSTTAELFVEAPSTTLPNQSINVTIAAKFAEGKTIYATSDDQTKTFSCAATPCIFSTTFSYAQPGEKTISVQLDSITETRTIAVTAVSKRCLDGTVEGTCSSPPFFCQNAQLAPNCTLCGCPSGEECISNTCTKPPLTFSIPLVTVPEAVYTTSAATLQYSIQNTSTFNADGLFLLVAQSYSSSEQLLDERAQQIQLHDLAPSGIHTGNVSILFPANTASVRLRLYDNPAAYPSSTLLSESSRTPVRVTTDTIPPLPPTQLSSTSSNGETLLTWTASPSTDVKKYIIFQENFSNGGFTTYSTAGETSSTQFSISPSASPLAYVVRAVDGAGNQSEPTSPVLVSS